MEFEEVSTLAKLRSFRGRQCIEVQGRPVTLFEVNGRIFAIDSRCYHTGGPLWEGQIEEIADQLYVLCPWHKYVIRLEDGVSILHPGKGEKMKANQLTVKGLKQRTHEVKVEGNNVFVKLSKLPGGAEEIASDHYCPATHEEKRRMGLLKPIQ